MNSHNDSWYDDLPKYFEEEITDSFDKMDQKSRATARRWLKEAIEDANQELKTFDAEHGSPELVAALVTARARHFQSLFVGKAIQEGVVVIRDGLKDISNES